MVDCVCVCVFVCVRARAYFSDYVKHLRWQKQRQTVGTKWDSDRISSPLQKPEVVRGSIEIY